MNHQNEKEEKGMRRYQKRKHTKKGLLVAIILIIAGYIIFNCLVAILYLTSPDYDNKSNQKNIADVSFGWNLILVNYDNYIPDDYEIELTELSNGEKIDSRIYPELQEMFDSARAEGVHLFVRAGYRTEEMQQQLLDEKIEAYENEGHSKSRARKLAEEWVALPGTSEHQLGIAVDINADTTQSSSDDVYDWLAENSYKYGFIYRYPADKTEITRIINEPWHYRYVGKEAAQEIYSQGICLEEYIKMLE